LSGSSQGHIEQPGSRHSKPALMKTWSGLRLGLFFTTAEPGTIHRIEIESRQVVARTEARSRLDLETQFEGPARVVKAEPIGLPAWRPPQRSPGHFVDIRSGGVTRRPCNVEACPKGVLKQFGSRLRCENQGGARLFAGAETMATSPNSSI